MNPTSTPCVGKALNGLYYITASSYFGPCRAICKVTTVDRRVENASLHISTYTLCRFIAFSNTNVPIPVTARSKPWVCSCPPAVIAGSNHTGSMEICLLEGCVLSGRGLCAGLITPTDCSVSEWDREASLTL